MATFQEAREYIIDLLLDYIVQNAKDADTGNNINLCSDVCKDYLLNKNYPLIKLKKINDLKPDEQYILGLIKNIL